MRIDALRLAVHYLRTYTRNHQKYAELAVNLNDLLASKENKPSLVPIDQEWMESTCKWNLDQKEQLQSDLKMYRTNLIKESIRIGCNDLANHFYECGLLDESLKMHLQSKEYCTTFQHMFDLCMNVIKISLETENPGQASSYILKAESLPLIQENPALCKKLVPIKAILALGFKRFKDAADMFISIPFNECEKISDVFTWTDIALYAGICALASYDRTQMKTLLFANSNFNSFLELDHRLKDLLFDFHKSKFESCLEQLDSLKVFSLISLMIYLRRSQSTLCLDPYLNPHIEVLYSSIRRKALVNYLQPYTVVNLATMSTVFRLDYHELEIVLLSLIREKKINIRIDSENMVSLVYFKE